MLKFLEVLAFVEVEVIIIQKPLPLIFHNWSLKKLCYVFSLPFIFFWTYFLNITI